MEPIISPWLLYLINFITNLHLLVMPVFGLSAVFSLGLLIDIASAQMNNEDYFSHYKSFGYSDANAERAKELEIKKKVDEMKVKVKWFKLSFIIFCVSSLLFMFLPDRETILAMLAASYVTPDNIQAVQGNIVDFVSQIVNAVNQAGGK